MEEDNGPILAAPHFYWGACLVCNITAAKGKPLKRCSRCHSVYYCSPEHQRLHWKEHKQLCTHLSKAAQAAEQETFFCGAAGSSSSEWNKFRGNAVRTASVILARPLELMEQEVLLFPRTCRLASCHLAVGELQDCTACHAVTYCSDSHREAQEAQHLPVCRQLRLCRLLDWQEARLGVGLPAIPSHLDNTFLASAPDISHFLEQPWPGDHTNIIKEEADWAFLTNQLSGPLTLLDVGCRFLPSLGSMASLTIHVVGAGIVEMMGLIKWEYLAHRLPQLRSLKYVFIGPELEAESEDSPVVPPCSSCTSLGRSISYLVHCGTYSHYLKTGSPAPDLVLAQNCGFSEFQASEDCIEWTEGWAGLGALLQGSAPLVFTSYTSGEAEADLARLLDIVQGEVEVLERCSTNTMRSHRPIRDWERDGDRDLFYSNQFLSVVRRKDTVENLAFDALTL